MAAEDNILFRAQHSLASDLSQLVNFVYELFQSIVIWIFSPPSHATGGRRNNGLRIAVVGAGLSGVSSAAHCLGHGAEVIMFEARSKEFLGGIWARVNSTSSLQVYSVMYRFHPTVRWHRRYPNRERIVEEIRKLWLRYGLQERTHFDTPVHSVKRHHGKWVINDDPDAYGTFDGVVTATGTCGEPLMPHLPSEEEYQGIVCHSSELEGRDVEGKHCIIIGGGASAIEAVEYVIARGAKRIDIVARSDKWIIPRNIIVDFLLSMNIFGEETVFSIIPETYLRWFFYRDLKDLAPHHKGFYTGTPMCNDQILEQIRAGAVRWLKADVIQATHSGLLINHRHPNVPKGGPGEEMSVDADLIIKATGFARPGIKFLPQEVFQAPYAPPAWYVQTFPPAHPELCAINSIYVNALGTVGHIHIGMYTRLLMVFLLEPKCKPSQTQMERWVSWVGWAKGKAPASAFEYFTYSELMLWFVEAVFLRPYMWQWAWFVFTGLGQAGPKGVSTAATARMKAEELRSMVGGE